METTIPLDLRAVQKPIKQAYRKDPTVAVMSLRAHGPQKHTLLNCSVDLGQAIYEARAHKGVGGSGGGACSGDLLLGALSAYAQITCPVIAEGVQIPVEEIGVVAEDDLTLRGTLRVSHAIPVGVRGVRLAFKIVDPAPSEQQIRMLREKTEQYCVAYQTLLKPPHIDGQWRTANTPATETAK